MRNLIILLFLTCFNSSSFSQDWQWAKVFGSEFTGQGWQGEDYLQMEVDDSGNVYICGLTWPEAYFDGDTLYHNSNDTILGSQIFLAKYDCQGNRKWIRHFGNLLAFPYYESDIYFALNKVVGRILVRFEPGYREIYFTDSIYNTTNAGEIFVLFDAEGNRLDFIESQNNYNGGNFFPHSFQATENGFVFMGESRGGATFPTDTGFSDTIDAAYPLIVHLDSNGLYEKHVVIENEKFFDVVERRGFTLDKDENYYFTGTLNDRGDSLVSGNVRVGRTNQWANGIVAKFSFDGSLEWHFKTDGLLLEGFISIDINDEGEVAVGGIGSKDVIIENDTFYTNGHLANRGILLLILDKNGSYISTGVQDLDGISKTSFRNLKFNGETVYAYDYFVRSITFNGSTINAIDTSDLFLSSYDVQGKTWNTNNLISSLMVRPGVDFEEPWDIEIDNNNSVYILGNHENGIIFNNDTVNIPSTAPFRGADGFLMKYGVEECPTPVSDNAQEDLVVNELKKLSVFPNPNRGSFQLSFSEEVEGEVQIFSYDGRLVYHQAYKPSENINLDVPSGIYLVSLQTSEGERFGAKVVVE